LFYFFCFFFSSRRRHTRSDRDWSSDVCSSDLDELRRILDSIGSCQRPRSHLDAPTMRCLVLLMYGAALRTSEALSLTIGDVDLSCGVLTVRDSKFFKTRLVPIGPKTVQMLAEYGSRRERCSRRPDAPFFVGRNARPVAIYVFE